MVDAISRTSPDAVGVSNALNVLFALEKYFYRKYAKLAVLSGTPEVAPDLIGEGPVEIPHQLFEAHAGTPEPCGTPRFAGVVSSAPPQLAPPTRVHRNNLIVNSAG
jgi:hypothetical protein